MGGGFYPHGGPRQWSYTKDFLGKFPKTGIEAAGNQVFGASGLTNSFQNPKIIGNLEALVSAARDSELAFLAKYNLPNPGNDWGELVKAFNLIFQSEDQLRRSLQLIQQVINKDDSTSIFHGFSAVFSGYLQKATRDIATKLVGVPIEDWDSLLDQVIENALRAALTQTDYVLEGGKIKTSAKKADKANAKELQVFRPLLEVIHKFSNNEFLSAMKETFGLKELLQDTIAQKEANQLNGTRKALPLIKSSVRNGHIKGTVGELFEMIGAQMAVEHLGGSTSGGDFSLSWETLWTGKSGVKADVISTNITVAGQVPDLSQLQTQRGENDSKRVNAIENYINFFTNIAKDAEGDIVFISDKNYQITSDFGGFHAQDKVTLDNLGGLLRIVDAPMDVDRLIDFLSNCGEDMMLGRAEADVMDAVATQIGYFLFDDLSITGAAPKVGRVHLLNLSSIYLPLSVYLEGTLRAIQGVEGNVKQFVNVTFVPGGDEATLPWSEDAFNDFRMGRTANSYVNVHFMKDFAAFITSQVKF